MDPVRNVCSSYLFIVIYFCGFKFCLLKSFDYLFLVLINPISINLCLSVNLKNDHTIFIDGCCAWSTIFPCVCRPNLA